jgi:hypothetical protein
MENLLQDYTFLLKLLLKSSSFPKEYCERHRDPLDDDPRNESKHLNFRLARVHRLDLKCDHNPHGQVEEREKADHLGKVYQLMPEIMSISLGMKIMAH